MVHLFSLVNLNTILCFRKTLEYNYDYILGIECYCVVCVVLMKILMP